MIEEVWKVWSEYSDLHSSYQLRYNSYLSWPPEEVMEDILQFITPLYTEFPMADDIMHAFHVMYDKKCGLVRLRPMKLSGLYEKQICDAFMSIDGDELHLTSPENQPIIVPPNGIVGLSWRRSEREKRGTIFDFDEKYFSLNVIPIVLNGNSRGQLYDWGNRGHFGRVIRRENGFEIVQDE
jgi:hypothetical protein